MVTKYDKYFYEYSSNPQLFAAILTNDIESVKVLASSEVINARSESCGQTPLLVTAYFYYTSMAVVLLKKKADIEITNQFGMDVFMIAAYFGYYEYLKQMLSMEKYQHMWDKTCNSGKTALFYAVMNKSEGNIACVKALLKAGFDPSKTDNEGQTAAQIASENGFEKMVDLLLVAENRRTGRKFI